MTVPASPGAGRIRHRVDAQDIERTVLPSDAVLLGVEQLGIGEQMPPVIVQDNFATWREGIERI